MRQRHALAAQRRQWQPLAAFTLDGWLDDWIEQALLCGDVAPDEAPRGRLSSLQERLLWEQAIERSLRDLDAAPLFDQAGLAAAAQQANRLLVEWAPTLDTAALAEETRQLLRWRQRFQGLCEQGGWLEPVRYFRWQLEVLESGTGALPEAVVLAGFDRLSPLQQRLVDSLRARGVTVDFHAAEFTPARRVGRVELADQDAECRSAVEWARRWLDRDPVARLAIVVPELGALRAKLAGLLDEALHPGCVTPQQAQAPRRYDFSLGVPLDAQPVVAAALKLLRFALQRQAVPQDEISELLLNPYWSDGLAEADARAQLDARMREWLPLTLTAQRFQRLVQQSLNGEHALPLAALARDLPALLACARAQDARQLPSAWAAAFRAMLDAARWPGDRSRSSHEFQAQQSFEKSLQALAELDGLIGALRAPEAIRRLDQLCREQIFQPEAADLPQLQLLGMLEAVAEPLDALWVMGMNDHLWPPPPAPNPLLPAALQRAIGMPNADSRVQMAFAATVQRRLLASAREVVFSSARMDGERVLRISPLLYEVPLTEAEYPPFATLAETLAADAGGRLRLLDDARAPAVEPGEHVSGGTGLLKAQAICPAWAFYQYRLHARALKTPVNGLDAMERGTLVHAALERFWAGRGLAEVRAMAPAALEAVVAEAATQALERFDRERDDSLSAPLIALERERLCRLVLFWLREVELARDVDFTVTGCEQEARITIEGIAIRLVLDRIDTLDDGSLVLLDYKTGRQNGYRNWADDRITEPQLPIYAAFVLDGQDVAAVCFAQVRIDDSKFSGVSRVAGVVPGAVALAEDKGRKLFAANRFPDWPAVLAHWKNSIERVARELGSGVAAVRFENEKELAYCEVLPLLRLPERLLQYERPELIAAACGAAPEDATP